MKQYSGICCALALFALTVCSIGCSTTQALDQVRDTETTPVGFADLSHAFAVVLEGGLDGQGGWAGGCDIERTAAYYREQPPTYWQMQDLNGDGIDEAIYVGAIAIYPTAERTNVGGATGNVPAFAFEQIDGRWHVIADLGGCALEVQETTANGWAVLTNSWKISMRAYPTSVQVYENGRYHVVYIYTFVPEIEY